MHRIRIEHEPEAAVLVAEGELDAYDAPELTAKLDDIGDHRQLVADLSKVSFMDSTALGVLLRALRALAERGSQARVVLPETAARRIFEITTLDNALPVAASREEALRELRVGG